MAVTRANDMYTTKLSRWDLVPKFCGRFDTITVFLFLGFLSTLAAMVLVFLGRRSSNKHSAV